jgi:hypothetical protein
MTNDFYSGYNRTMPDGVARFVRRVVGLLLALAVMVPALLVVVQGRFSTATFEFGHVREVEGRLVEFPYPAFDVDGPGRPSRGFYWLVGPGKHGAAPLVRGLDGRRVRLRATRIERDGDDMLQVESDGIRTIDDVAADAAVPAVSIRPVHVVGEIVDGKCHLGVMKPGEGPTHRDCAVRCLLGSVVPLLVVHGERDVPERLALIDERHHPLVADFTALAGRPVRVVGELVAQGPRRFLSVRAGDIEVLR